MDPVGAPLANDVQNQSHRQSILGSFLRVRPRGASQSGQVDHDQVALPDSANSLSAQPPSPNPGHRRRPAAGTLQPSISVTHGFGAQQGTTSVSVHGLSQMLRRRRSANGALNSSSANPSMAANSLVDSPTTGTRGHASSTNPATRSHRIRLVPHLDSTRSLHFEPISRDVREGDAALRIGRFTDRSGMGVTALNAQNTNKLAFKSKVVSRAHAEVWCDPGGKFFIKDTKSSSGTFLNHIRLSAPNAESRPFPIKDGDVLQLGVDYQGGTEEIYKCVKMRLELGREWQAQPNAFNTNALKQLKALSAQPLSDKPALKGAIAKSGISDCCICLFSVTVHQSLFIAPCSHVFHYKCIRPMLLMHHPGFSCPLCRTFANLEEDVEIDFEDPETDNADGLGSGGSGAEGTPSDTNAPGRDPMDIDAAINLSAVLHAANEAAAQANGAATGAETEVERDLASSTSRRIGNGSAAVRNEDLPTPLRNGHIEPVQEDGDDFPLAETEDEGDDLHPLPALPVPTPSGPLPVPSASTSAPMPLQGFGIQRPMSVPVPVAFRRMAMDDDAYEYADADEILVGMVAEADASGSYGEGPVAVAGSGEKRKR